MEQNMLLKRLAVIAVGISLFVFMLGGCDKDEDKNNTAQQQYQSCITQKKAAGVTDVKACELCGGSNCGTAPGVDRTFTGGAPAEKK